jgi:hypothetical protein
MSTINQSNTDKFAVVFSNLPVPSTRNDKFNMDVIDNYVRYITLPDYNVEVVRSEFKEIIHNNPIPKFNNDLSPITIEFTADEDMENYISFFEWMREIRLGNPLKGETTLRESTIKSLDIIIKDNQDRKTSKMVIKDLLLINISSLNLAFGNSEQNMFTCTFQYHTFDIERFITTRNN